MIPPFQICGNDVVVEQSLLSNSGVCITNTLIFPPEGRDPKISALILLCYAKIQPFIDIKLHGLPGSPTEPCGPDGPKNTIKDLRNKELRHDKNHIHTF